MKHSIKPDKLVVFTGAGISAESGLQTFRDTDGLWETHSIEDVASVRGWQRNPELVLNFYNARRQQAAAAQPNAAHLAIAQLEEKYAVTVITQNIDALHERAGSSQVVHLHGELSKVRSTRDPQRVYDLGAKAIQLGDCCDLGAQLRPDIVWFGECIRHWDLAQSCFATASKLLVVGTSLQVEPAASLLHCAPAQAEKIIVGMEAPWRDYGYSFVQGKATARVPEICKRWLAN